MMIHDYMHTMLRYIHQSQLGPVTIQSKHIPLATGKNPQENVMDTIIHVCHVKLLMEAQSKLKMN